MEANMVENLRCSSTVAFVRQFGALLGSIEVYLT